MVKHTQSFRRQQPKNCLSVFDDLVGLTLKRLSYWHEGSKLRVSLGLIKLAEIWVACFVGMIYKRSKHAKGRLTVFSVELFVIWTENSVNLWFANLKSL